MRDSIQFLAEVDALGCEGLLDWWRVRYRVVLAVEKKAGERSFAHAGESDWYNEKFLD